MTEAVAAPRFARRDVLWTRRARPRPGTSASAAWYNLEVRAPLLLVALSTGGCQSAPPLPAPSPVRRDDADPPLAAAEPIVDPPLPMGASDAAAPTPVPTPASADPIATPSVEAATPAPAAPTPATPGVVVAHRELPEALVDRLRLALPDHTAACDLLPTAPCAFEGDIDGDGLRDGVVLVRDDRRQQGIAVLWGKGGSELIGAGRRDLYWKTTEVANIDGTPNDPPGRERVDADLTWIEAWELWPIERKGSRGAYVGRVARSKHRFGAPGALGDGLMLSSSDAAVVVYRTERGWTQMHLGF